MYLKWGNYTHPIGEPQIGISMAPILTNGGIPVAHRVQWDIRGMLLGSGQADLDTKIRELIEAYSKNNQDLILLRSDGKTESQHTLKRRSTRGGTWVVSGPNFPEGGGAEYVTRRAFSLQIAGEVPVRNPATALMSFTETLSLYGGGPRFSHVETANGLPVKQQLKRATTYQATQSGNAVGYSRYPFVPDPIFGTANLEENPRITYKSPEATGSGFSNYAVSWEYKFASAYPLSGLPNFRV